MFVSNVVFLFHNICFVYLGKYKMKNELKLLKKKTKWKTFVRKKIQDNKRLFYHQICVHVFFNEITNEVKIKTNRLHKSILSSFLGIIRKHIKPVNKYNTHNSCI